jgi:tetratricopeptide (TPR) repeat protein
LLASIAVAAALWAYHNKFMRACGRLSLSILFAILIMEGPRVHPQQQSSAAGHSPVKNDSTESLQALLDRQQRATSSADPAAVAASSQALTELAAQQIDETHAAQKRSGLSAEIAHGLKVREHQLRQILSNGFNDWGTAEAREQHYGEALKHFQEAERWDPSTPGLMRNLGAAAFQVENYEESARALATAVSANPKDQSSRLMLAMSQFSLERFTEAEKNFAPINKLAMQDPRTAYAWAYTLVRTHQPLQANGIADILSGQDLPPDARLLVCKLYTASETFARAISCLQRLAAMNPSMLDVHYELGATLIRLDRPAEAITELRTELKLDPEDLDAKFYLAFALLQTQQKEAAIPLLRSVLATNPNYSEAQYQLGKVLLDQDNVDEAVEHLEAAAKLDADNAIVHYQLQVAYRRMGRTADATRELERYKDLKASQRNSVVIPGIQPTKHP